jgi:hypothetical protein
MLKRFTSPSFRPVPLVAAVLSAMLMLVLASPALAQSPDSSLIFPQTDSPFGMTYTDWSVAWWQWALELPVAGHPFTDPGFVCNSPNNDQSGPVWFLALAQKQMPEVERSCTIPANTAVFIGLVTVECSSRERPIFPEPFAFGAKTEELQIECATHYANQIVVDQDTPFCEIDGERVANLGSFRFPSPQFTFTAPTPWIFGKHGGDGTAVGDGYFLMLKPLSSGTHTLRCGGKFDFGGGAVAEFGNIYQLTVP